MLLGGAWPWLKTLTSNLAENFYKSSFSRHSSISGHFLCSVVVFGCISNKVNVDLSGTNFCLYNFSTACNFGITIGVIGFVMCLAFLLKDVLFAVIDFSTSKLMLAKKVIIAVDVMANGVCALVWFVAFVYITIEWSKVTKSGIATSNFNCANSGVAFSFFSVFIWAAIVAVNVIIFVRIRQVKKHPPPVMKQVIRETNKGGITTILQSNGQ